MSEPWQHQLRLYLTAGMADRARDGWADPAFAPLTAILDRHGASLLSQYDAFAAYVAEAEANGTDRYELYSWTKATLGDPAKRARHRAAFAVHVAGSETYDKAVADALEIDLQPVVGSGLVERLSHHDTNPANNLPVPPEHRA